MKKVIITILVSLILSFIIPLVKSDFLYWDFLEISTKILAYFVIIMGLTLISLIVMKIVSSITNRKDKIPLKTLYFQSWIMALVLISISLLSNKFLN
ncbi:hypothetical protein [Polaribacter glomeratus]|uniref:hypothetical protein n=1 Tax=Polaribacter glomeratus TaxID=102 RepID=UPI0011B0A297|nr:hypothetical protein [Polaribacter glomeratus]TXD66320.1 hypothetical protein ESX12_05925 [Polaribacter glomeratus]